jgi:NAD-dependent DNA ligase
MSAAASTTPPLHTLVARLTAASHAYHNGLLPLMTDAEYDAAVDQLTALAPDHPFLSRVGAPLATGDEVTLPHVLPSLNKIKATDDSLPKWLMRNPGANYHVSQKLDGCSALWLPKERKLYTRGDGVKGRDISAFVPYFKGLSASSSDVVKAVRGELIMRSDSAAIPAGKIARNIVAGALNRKEVDTALFAEIRFVAYELIDPPTLTPLDASKALRAAGYEIAPVTVLPSVQITPDRLSALFSSEEAASPYAIDGIVVAPNTSRPLAPTLTDRMGVAQNPADRVAWKTRLTATTATTIVRAVEWNVSASGYLIPRVLFDTVTLAGANISAATGLHARWISDNAVGPGAVIEIRRAGDVIPQIVAVHTPSPTGPALPPTGTWTWITDIHAAATAETPEAACARLTRALTELGAENIGPGLVARLFAAGFTTLGAMYSASAADFATRVEGVKTKGAERIYAGLRAKQSTWTELTFLCASCVFPRGIGHTRLTPLLALNPVPSTWDAAALAAANPAGLSSATIDAICAAIPAYIAWRTENFPDAVAGPSPVLLATKAGAAHVVFTGFRDKALETALIAAGHVISDTVTRKTTHVLYVDGPEPSSTKITKAREYGTAQILSVSAGRAALL